MEKKKEPAKDVFRRERLYGSIGLALSLAAVIMAFEWRSHPAEIVDLSGMENHSHMETVEVPVTALTPPKPAPRPVVFVVKDDDEPETLEMPPIDLEGEIPDDPPVQLPDPELAPDLPFIIVEEPASPEGGIQAFYLHVRDRLNGRYPPTARRLGIEGSVFVEFIVERDGRLTDVRVIKGIGGGCDELATKAVESAPAWKPGRQRGKPVRQRCTLPIVFKLN
jgi:protein TonB